MYNVLNWTTFVKYNLFIYYLTYRYLLLICPKLKDIYGRLIVMQGLSVRTRDQPMILHVLLSRFFWTLLFLFLATVLLIINFFWILVICLVSLELCNTF